MKKNIVVLLLFMTCNIYCFSQDIFLEKQKGFQYKRYSFLDSLNVKEPNFKYVDIELRVHYILFAADTLNRKFMQIIKDKNGLWSGKSYSYYFYNDNNYNYKDVIIDNLSLENWDSVWQTIVKENYLNLPTESDIKQKGDMVVVVCDGQDYTIEVLTKKKKRCISYGNPELKYERYSEYGIEYYEYERFLQLIQLLRTELDL